MNKRLWRRPSLLDPAIPPTENNRGLLWDPADGFAKGPQPNQGFGLPKLPKLIDDPGRGDGADRTVNQPASPFGPSDGADPWAAGSMADVLLRKNDYADAVTHYQGQANTEPPAEVGLTPLVIDIYNTHQEDDSFDPKDSDTIQVADASERINAPFVAKAGPDEIIQRAKAHGGWLSTGGDTAINGGKECVALVKAVVPEVGATKTWYRGEDIQGDGNPPLKPGTAIASGWNAQGGYDSKSRGNHAAIFIKYGVDPDTQKPAIQILDQYAPRGGDTPRNGQPAKIHWIPIGKAREFSVITRQ